MCDKRTRDKFSIFILLFVGYLTTGVTARADIRVSMPDTSVIQNSQFSLPILVEGISGSDSVVAYQATLSFDPELIALDDITQESTMTRAWNQPTVNFGIGTCRIAGFSTNASDQRINTENNHFLIFHFHTLAETTATSPIGIDEFKLYNLTTQISTTSIRGAQIQLIKNVPPSFKGVMEITIDEDQDATFSLMPYIQDTNDPVESLTVTNQASEHIQITWQPTTFQLQIHPEANYDSTAFVVIELKDPYLETATDTLWIYFQPVPDAPSDFALRVPENYFRFEEDADTLNFSWEAAEDVDCNDSIQYTFYLCDDPTFNGATLKQYSNLVETSIRIAEKLELHTDHYWIVRAEDTQKNKVWSSVRQFSIGEVSGIRENKTPGSFAIKGNYPNPFNPQTTIHYELSEANWVEMQIFNISGNLVSSLISERQQAGMHTLIWDGCDNTRNRVASGLYFCQLKSGNRIARHTMMLLR